MGDLKSFISSLLNHANISTVRQHRLPRDAALHLTLRGGDCRPQPRIGWEDLAVGSEETELSVIVILIIIASFSQLLKVDLIAQDSTNTTKTLNELVTLARPV